MKWENDTYKDLKFVIFDILRKELNEEDGEKITIKMLVDGIDELFKNLIDNSNAKDGE